MKTILSTLVLLLLVTAAQAEAPRVRFDAPQTVAARDVTTAEFAFVHPRERLIEVRVPLSLLVDAGGGDVRELIHRLESTTAGAQAVDYFPKTTLGTTVVGTTRVERNKSRDLRATADVAGGYYGVASGQAHAAYAQRAREDVRYEELPALELLTASGTVDRGRGVYYKLRPSKRTTLEGAHEYTVVLRVPRAWRTGLMYVSSEARAADDDVLGRGRFVIALYQQGDAQAQETAQRYALAEAALRQVAHAHRHELARRADPTPLHKLGVTRDNALRRDWLDTAIFRGVADTETLGRLPGDVRLTAEALLKAREELLNLHRAPALGSIEG